MQKLLISASLAGLLAISGPAMAQDAHHDHATPSPAATPMKGAPMKCGKHHRSHGRGHAMHCKRGAAGMEGMSGMHGGGMMGNGGMGPDHMQQMHDHMDHGAMMKGGMMGSGGMMGGAQPSGTPSPDAPK